ncbi:G2/mitotic-specific cyclin S13-7-like [Abrus precatorius]|uniref:B-like cyclin n=1 Tax=Abrus precatorius TaxID=3816 RepID=A0A8B8KHX5_ABRPR|nr:G2/mitotic-specific cyclin S13-7-like [Abrus precatorius]
MDSTRGRGKIKEESQQGNRQVLGDIGNLEAFSIAEGKQILRPVKRRLLAKLLENEQTNPVLEVQANEQGAAQGNKHVVVAALDKNAIVHQEHYVEDLFHKLNPELADVVGFEARKKAASGILVEGEDQPVDIDANDANEVVVAEYLDDMYKFYKLTEEDYQALDYMKSQHNINEMMRSITVDWLVDVHMKFKFKPETLYLTVNIIDRYLSLTIVSKEELQLVGIGSMLLACKYEEIWSPQVKDFVSISDNAYTNNRILSMEKTILEKLEWHLTIPTLYVFLVRFIRASGLLDQLVENMAYFLAELGLTHYKVAIFYCPSMTAAAAVYAARCTLNRRPFWTEILMYKAGYRSEQIR